MPAGKSVCVAWAPGRINLIGEHTDYSGGPVLPVAVQYGVSLDVTSTGGEIALESAGFGAAAPFAADGAGPAAAGWARYAQAVAVELDLLGRRAHGDDRLGSLRRRRPLVVGGARGRRRARTLCRRRLRDRAARTGAGLPSRRAARDRRPVRDPRPGGVVARTTGPRDPARLRHARACVSRCYRRFGYFQTESSEHAAEYVPWIMRHDEELERYRVPVGEYIRRSEDNPIEFERVKGALASGEEMPLGRSNEYAATIVDSMVTGEPSVIYGNVANTGLIPGLPEGTCVEVPCVCRSRIWVSSFPCPRRWQSTRDG